MAPTTYDECDWETGHHASGTGMAAVRFSKKSHSTHSSSAFDLHAANVENKVLQLARAFPKSKTEEHRASNLEELCRLVDGPCSAANVMRQMSVLSPALKDKGMVRSAALSLFRKVAEEGEAAALGTLLPSLPSCLADLDVHVRRKAVVLCRVIAECGGAASIATHVPLLVACLEAEDPVLRVTPLEALRSMAASGETRVVTLQAFAAIVHALSDESSAVRSAAAEALEPIFADGCEATLQSCTTAGMKILDVLVKLSLNSDCNARVGADRALLKAYLANIDGAATMKGHHRQACFEAFQRLDQKHEQEIVLDILCNRRVSWLKGLFELCGSSQGALLGIAKHFEVYCREQFTKAAVIEDTSMYIRKLLRLHSELHDMVATCFCNNSAFQKARDDGIEAVLNKDSQFAKHLARYCDSELKKGVRMADDQEFQGHLDSIVRLFSHVKDKDIFLETYRRILARRLLNRAAISSEVDGIFIARLTVECGKSATKKLSSMLTDLTLSEQLHQEYSKMSHRGSPQGISHQVSVLRTNAWPAMPNDRCIVPCSGLLACARAFEEFYCSKFSGRKLTWVYSQGSADMSTRCFLQKHILTVSTLQCIVLSLFNRKAAFTFKDICEATRLHKSDCKQQLASMCLSKHNLLVQDPSGTEVDEDTRFSVNREFTSERTKVVVATLRKEESVSQAASVDVSVERRPLMDAAIVRIMKARQRLPHNMLVEEVMRQCRLFKAQPPQIKVQIERLIERDFIKRDLENRHVYIYVS